MIDIFNEALQDESCANLDTRSSEARLLLGVKIEKENDNGEITIKDCSRSSFYGPINADAYEMFKWNGWRHGVLYIFDERYTRREGLLLERIHEEKVSRNRARVINALRRDIERLKDRRAELLTKYGYEKNI